DTDRERSTEESVNAILDGMAWLDLAADEGPFYQTQRFDRYRQVIEQLLAEGKAYYCYCSKERLETLRSTQREHKQKPRYDGHCRHLANSPDTSIKPVIRFKNPEIGEVVVKDLIKGTVIFNNQELDDLIIARSNGTPTYNLTVVVDDWDMRISHVIRGDDHLNNTPRQINILTALGADIPQYAHVSMILGTDGQRLSKRHGAVSIMNYKEAGYLPVALLNYLVRLGWSYGDQEVFSIAEMVKLFDLSTVHSSAATFDMEKLLWLNQQHIKTTPLDKLANHLQFYLNKLKINPTPEPALTEVIQAQVERAKTLVEMAENSRLFFTTEIEYDAKAVKKHLKPAIYEPLTALSKQLEQLVEWNATNIHAVIHNIAEQYQLKLGKIAQPLRVSVTGGTISPSIDVTVYLIGQQLAVARVQHALTLIPNNSEN
ncbi:MAG: glutamate--tRNA ligase, partial [Thiomargarita sp.]|nr:glutamate--tRNA ligase [Thiomargarita sp.]